jgi:imidazolonepropionase-like amidohydrolase
MTTIIKNYFYLLLILVTFSTCRNPYSLSDHSSGTRKSKEQGLFAIRNVTIIPMTLVDTLIENATVVISGNKILSINGEVPDGAEIIDGRGKWLMPGLIDMHVHIPTDGHFNTSYPSRAASIFTNTQDIMMPFITNGVTTVFDLNSRAGHFGQRNEIMRGDVIGPRMALAAMIDGGTGDGRIVNTPEDGRQAVRSAKAEGYEFIKVYSKLNVTTYNAIIEEAGKQGMKVIGHIPNAFKGNIGGAFVSHFDMVAHAEEFFKQTEDGEQVPELLAQIVKGNGSWVCPTLVVIEAATAQGRSLDFVKKLPTLQYVHPLLQSKWQTANNYNKNATAESISRLERMIKFNKNLVKAFKKAGVPIVAGTDAGTSGVVWGFSLHDELELLVEAGLTTKEVLHSATRIPASWLGLDDKIGTVEPGKFADLILLDANPLIDIKNTRKISGVFVNGRWLDKKEINNMLVGLAKRNAETKDKWDWQKRNEY